MKYKRRLFFPPAPSQKIRHGQGPGGRIMSSTGYLQVKNIFLGRIPFFYQFRDQILRIIYGIDDPIIISVLLFICRAAFKKEFKSRRVMSIVDQVMHQPVALVPVLGIVLIHAPPPQGSGKYTSGPEYLRMCPGYIQRTQAA